MIAARTLQEQLAELIHVVGTADELELELNEQFDEEWMERVLLLDVTPELGASHDPMDYLLAKGVRASLRAALFDKK